MSEQPTQLEKKRHTLAHLLAAAVLKEYPKVQLTLGPAVDNGFYYDIDFGDEKIEEKDLKRFQKNMRKMLSSWKQFGHIAVGAQQAQKIFNGNEYKIELLQDILDRDEDVTIYYAGPADNEITEQALLDASSQLLGTTFFDLCRGGHLENPAEEIDPKSFELSHMAGAYWRGDENNAMLTRIYGLAFDTAEELANYKDMLEEAKKRDHRKLGKELDLFTSSDLVGAGLPLFTPKGTVMREAIVEKIMNIQKEYGYQKVWTPHITKKELYETSGHWAKFGEELFHVHGGHSDSDFVMKPMNCPHHTQIFASQPRSYRDMPIRYSEPGTVYRDEQTGELSGISRVRSLTIDDGHIFCRPDQVKQEVENVVHIIRDFYTTLGMWGDESSYWVSLSVRDSTTPEKYLGKSERWDEAEKILEDIIKEEGIPYKRIEGEAAFYGPKIDFQFYDAIRREHQLGTVQLDFVMPERFELEYTDRDGEKKTPVMIHRAIAGSLERFLSVIIEHFAGAFPVWLSPVQVAILPINDDAHGDYAESVYQQLKDAGVRAEYHPATDSLGKRIRTIKKSKIPYALVLGDAEKDSKTITAEGRNDEKLEGMSVEEFIQSILD